MAGASADGSRITDAVLAHALRMRQESLPPSARAAAEMLIFDAIGVGVVGSTTPQSQNVLAAARSWGQGAQASVWGTDESLPAPDAALVNSHQVHCLEFDPIHEGAVVHPLTVVLPVLSAWVQRSGRLGHTVSGRDFVTAVAVGVDVAGGLGDVTTSPLRFFRPATAGALGAVAALTVITSDAPEVAAAAFGIAYSGLCGTMQAHEEGLDTLALQIGLNARAALCSWDLAARGFQGPRQVLEGRYGYFELFEESGEPELLCERLGARWEIERTSIKPYPSGRATHGVLDATLELQERHGFSSSDVEAVDAWVPPLVQTLAGRPATDGLSPGAARLCLSYLVAYGLREHRVGIDATLDEHLRDPELLETARRVAIHTDDNPDPNAFHPVTVRVRLQGGTEHELTLDSSLGSPERPLPWPRLEAKFRANLAAADRSARVEEIFGLAREVSHLDDVQTLLDSL